MASKLEDAIRQMVGKGELTHLSLIPAGRDGWSASFSPASAFGSVQVTADDPVEALVEALNWKPPRKSSAPDETPTETKPKKEPWE